MRFVASIVSNCPRTDVTTRRNNASRFCCEAAAKRPRLARSREVEQHAAKVGQTTQQVMKRLCAERGYQERIWRTPLGDAPVPWYTAYRYHATVHDAAGELLAEVRDAPAQPGDPVRRVRRALLRQLDHAL
jgi:hypothetical protein